MIILIVNVTGPSRPRGSKAILDKMLLFVSVSKEGNYTMLENWNSSVLQFYMRPSVRVYQRVTMFISRKNEFLMIWMRLIIL